MKNNEKDLFVTKTVDILLQKKTIRNGAVNNLKSKTNLQLTIIYDFYCKLCKT